MKPNLLWVGDAVCSSGFARATHHTLDVLKETFSVHVLGLNSQGTPHDYPYDIWPCYPGGDLFGRGRMQELIGRIQPDLIVIQNDPWNFPGYLKHTAEVPVVGAVAVDGMNCQGHLMNRLALAVFWTKFGEREARKGGYTGQSAVVPLGVDLELYKPMDRVEARVRCGLPHDLRDKFIIGNVNRNQPRKRMDLTVSIFCEWISTRGIDDAYLYLHVAPTGEDAYDVGQLMSYYGYKGKDLRLLTAEPEIFVGLPEYKVAWTYSMFDAMLTTTQGEGWGLTTMEGMACGIPQIVPDWAALGEWATAAMRVPCSEIAVTPTSQKSPIKLNVIGGVIDRRSTLDALDQIYADRKLRQQMSEDGLALVQQPQYRWPNVGAAFRDAIVNAMYPMGVGA